MKIVVKHTRQPGPGPGVGVATLPGVVTVEAQADDGMAIVGDEPVELTLGQQANIELTEGGGKITVQAVIE